jgi:hypothetical protein
VVAGLAISLLALGVFWLVVYDASPAVAAIVILEAVAVIGLAFGVAVRAATKAGEAKLRRE